jgi:hypothetical protein
MNDLFKFLLPLFLFASPSAWGQSSLYRWDDVRLQCEQLADGKLVSNSYCGKDARQISVYDSSCSVSIDGVFQLNSWMSRGEGECPPRKVIWDEQRKTCRDAYEAYRTLPNSDCGQEARQIVVASSYCTVVVDGYYEKFLDRGEEQCPAIPTTNSEFQNLLPDGYKFQKIDFNYDKTQCGELAFKLDGNSDCTVEFLDFSLDSSWQDSRSCDLELVVHLPQGLRMKPSRFSVEGDYQHGPGGSILVKGTYGLAQGEKSVVNGLFNASAGNTDTFLLQTDAVNSESSSSCGGKAVFRGRFELHAFKSFSSSFHSLVTLDRIEQGKQVTIWGWDYQTCQDEETKPAVGASGRPYCGAHYYGCVFPCAGKACAKSDKELKQECEISRDSTAPFGPSHACLGGSGFPYCPTRYYGTVFSCNGYRCAKSDPQYKNVCQII